MRPEAIVINGLVAMVLITAMAVIGYRLIRKAEFDVCAKKGFQIKTDHNGVSCYK